MQTKSEILDANPNLISYRLQNEENKKMKKKTEILAENPNLISYRVMLREEKGDKFQICFDCYAENDDHAEEQAENAYPGSEITTILPFMGNDIKTAKEIAEFYGHTNIDSNTTLLTKINDADVVDGESEEMDLRICGVGDEAFFEWITEYGDPIGDVFYMTDISHEKLTEAIKTTS
jgi:hypothetical protein